MVLNKKHAEFLHQVYTMDASGCAPKGWFKNKNMPLLVKIGADFQHHNPENWIIMVPKRNWEIGAEMSQDF